MTLTFLRCGHNLMGYEALQLIKDFTMEHTYGAVEFYLIMIEEWSNSKLMEHLRTSFESGESFRSLLSDFYC